MSAPDPLDELLYRMRRWRQGQHSTVPRGGVAERHRAVHGLPADVRHLIEAIDIYDEATGFPEPAMSVLLRARAKLKDSYASSMTESQIAALLRWLNEEG